MYKVLMIKHKKYNDLTNMYFPYRTSVNLQLMPLLHPIRASLTRILGHAKGVSRTNPRSLGYVFSSFWTYAISTS